MEEHEHEASEMDLLGADGFDVPMGAGRLAPVSRFEFLGAVSGI